MVGERVGSVGQKLAIFAHDVDRDATRQQATYQLVDVLLGSTAVWRRTKPAHHTDAQAFWPDNTDGASGHDGVARSKEVILRWVRFRMM